MPFGRHPEETNEIKLPFETPIDKDNIELLKAREANLKQANNQKKPLAMMLSDQEIKQLEKTGTIKKLTKKEIKNLINNK